jgi:hypothetical protein
MYSPYNNSAVCEEVNKANNVTLATITAIKAVCLVTEDSGMQHNNER